MVPSPQHVLTKEYLSNLHLKNLPPKKTPNRQPLTVNSRDKEKHTKITHQTTTTKRSDFYQHTELGGVFKHVLFSPRKLGKMISNLTSIFFQLGLVQPPPNLYRTFRQGSPVWWLFPSISCNVPWNGVHGVGLMDFRCGFRWVFRSFFFKRFWVLGVSFLRMV